MENIEVSKLFAIVLEFWTKPKFGEITFDYIIMNHIVLVNYISNNKRQRTLSVGAIVGVDELFGVIPMDECIGL